jgi:hypothetical protein
MAYVGGIRARLIHDNVFNMVKDGLGELGWLASSVNRKDVTVLSKPIENDETARPNLVIVTTEDVTEYDAELGSLRAEQHWEYYIDVYAEDNVLGLHMATDLRDILTGKFDQSVSRVGPNLTVYDLSVSSATPIDIFHVDIQDVDVNRGRFSEKPYQKYWWMLSFTVVDDYSGESD